MGEHPLSGVSTFRLDSSAVVGKLTSAIEGPRRAGYLNPPVKVLSKVQPLEAWRILLQ